MGDYWSRIADAEYEAAMEELASREEQRSDLEVIQKRFDKLEEMLKKRDLTIKEILTMTKELREEYRIDHPLMDKLAKMADEWGIEEFSQDNGR